MSIYIPLLKYRPVELSALGDLAANGRLSTKKVFPLIEVIQEKTRSNSKKEFDQDIEGLTKECGNQLFVEIIKETPRSSTTRSVIDFLMRTSNSENYALSQIERLSKLEEKIIPVVSGNRKAIDVQRFEREAIFCHERWAILGYRVAATNWDDLKETIDKYMQAGEYLLLDVEGADPTNPILNLIYDEASALCDSRYSNLIIVNDPRPQSLKNIDLVNNRPIFEINNVLATAFSTMGEAVGFGDYAGVTSAFPSTGGAISPGAVFYAGRKLNLFVGYRGLTRDICEFNRIAEEIVASQYWEKLGKEHISNCPACKKIEEFSTTSNGRNQALWKRLLIVHYICAIEESI